MTTRSGRGYKYQEMSETETGPAGPNGASESELERGGGAENSRPEGSPEIMTVVQMLLQDRRRREEEIAEDRARRERDMEQRVCEVREQMDAICKMMERTGRSKTAEESLVKVAKLADTDDIEGYLLTFERQMIAYEIDKTGVHPGPAVNWKGAEGVHGHGSRGSRRLPVDQSGDPETLRDWRGDLPSQVSC